MGGDGVDHWPKGADCLEAFMPDVVIVQLGIVDCAPRLLNKFDRIILKLIPGSSIRKYISILKKIRKRNVNNTLVPLDRFKNNWVNYLNRAKKTNTKVIIISISLPDDSFLKKNPGININVKKYNDLLVQFTKEYDNVFLTKALEPGVNPLPVYEDGYHPNHLGHDFIYSQLKPLLV